MPYEKNDPEYYKKWYENNREIDKPIRCEYNRIVLQFHLYRYVI